jgi:hypothetical protein
MLRRVELKNRTVMEGVSPWSIRQTAIYHSIESRVNVCDIPQPDESKIVCAKPRSTFLLIAPSQNVQLQFIDCLKQNTSNDRPLLSAWNTHRILVADSLRGWMDYMAYLERRLKHQVTQFSQVLYTYEYRKATNTSVLNSLI